MTLHELLVDEIKDLYHAEKQLTKALPKMAKAATNDDVREAFERHFEETREQVSRLEQVFAALDEPVKAKPCKGIAGIIEEGSDLMEEDVEGAVLDAGLIAGAQRVEHYEIGAYGTCVAWARLLDLDDVVSLLEQTLEEEKAADKKLTQLAEQHVNRAAAAEGREDEEEEEEPRRARSAARGRGEAGMQARGAGGARRQSAGSPSGRVRAADRRRR